MRAIVDVVGSPVDFWRGVKCWDYGRDIFAMTPKTGGKSQNDGFHFMCFGAILYCNTTEFPCLRFHNQFQPRATRATVYQLRADVLCPDGMVNAFARIIGLVLPFVAKSLYTKLPARSGRSAAASKIQDGDRLCELHRRPGADAVGDPIQVRQQRRHGVVL